MSTITPVGHEERLTSERILPGMIAGNGVSAMSRRTSKFRCGCAFARQAPDDLAGRDDLPGVALGMFGCVEEQSEDVAGELGSANRTGHEELFV
jgi:hypothetical protein